MAELPSISDALAPRPLEGVSPYPAAVEQRLAGRAPDTTGMLAPGNLDPWNRPILNNPDGSYSTTSSISIGTDKGEVLIPTVINGKRLSNDDAIQHFKKTGENLGTFDTPDHADTYATALHNAQAARIEGRGLPSVDEALGAPSPPDLIQTIDQHIQQSTQRIFNAFTEGTKTGFGNAPIATPATALSKETVDSLKRAGIFNDYQQQAVSADSAMLEGAVRSAAAGLQLAGRGLSAVTGGVLQAVGQGVEDTGLVEKGSLTGEEGLAGAATDPFLAMFLGPEAEVAAAARMQRLNAIEADIKQGRALGTIGEGETGFHEVVPPTPETMQARTEAATDSGMAVPKPPPSPPTIHDLARQIEPEAFQKYDALAVAKDQHRQTISQLAAERENLPEAVAAKEEITTILGKVNGVEERLTKKAAERLADAQATLDRILTADSPDMAKARQALLDADIAQRDVVPSIAAAYRQAREITPDEVAAPRDVQSEPTPGEVKPEEPPSLPPNIAEKLEAPKPEPVEIKEGEDTGASITRPSAETGAPETTKIRVVGGLKPVEGTGDLKTRQTAQSLEASAIKEGLTEGFGDLPEYHAANFDEMLEKVAEYVNKDYDAAKEIAMGRKNPPKGMLPNAFLVAVKNRAEAEGDWELARDLAGQSKLVEQATTQGQNIAMLARIDKGSPTGAILEVQKARESDLARKNDVAQATDSEVKNIRSEMKAAASRSQAWTTFINAITCAE